MTRLLNLFCLAMLLALVAGCSLPPASARPAHYVVAGQEARIFETREKLTLFGQWWYPAQPPRAVVLLLHGTLAHSGFYDPYAEYMAHKGYAVFGIDLRGWGQSQGYGRRGFVTDYSEYLEDVRLAWTEVRQRYPQAPAYVQGESLGGTVALLAQSEGVVDAQGLILNAPALRPNINLGWFRPPMLLGKFTLWLAAQPGRLFGNAPLLPASVVERGIGLVLEDPEAQQRFRLDPLCTHTGLPLAYLTALQRGAARAEDGLGTIRVPLLVLHGTKDVLVPLASSEFVLRQVASPDKTLQVYEDMTHATLHDTERGMVWFDIVEWLDARTPVSGPAVPSTAFDLRAWLEAQQGRTAGVMCLTDDVPATAEEQ
jgi:acylglycerol lipase